MLRRLSSLYSCSCRARLRTARVIARRSGGSLSSLRTEMFRIFWRREDLLGWGIIDIRYPPPKNVNQYPHLLADTHFIPSFIHHPVDLLAVEVVGTEQVV